MPAHNFVINGAIAIGANTFTASSETISGAGGNLILTSIDHHGLGDFATLAGNIIIPAEATFGSLAFHKVKLAEGAKIYCAVKNCAQKMLDSCGDSGGYVIPCQNAVKAIIYSEDTFEQAPEGCDFWSADGCKKCSGPSFKMEDNYCLRKIYTPAEAAAAMNGDDNTITLTFKK